MSGLEPAEIAALAVGRYQRRVISFPYFVMELEQAVSASEGRNDAEVRELRRVWGQLEIINALALDEGLVVPQGDEEVDELITRFLSCVRDDEGRRDEGYV